MNDEIFKKLESRWDLLGFDNLEEDEKEAVALFWLEVEVMNGGLDQYFSNSSGDLYYYAVSGMERIKASKSLKLLKSAAEKLGERYPTQRDDRIDILEELWVDVDDPFDYETNLLQELPEYFLNMSLETLMENHADKYS